MDTKQYGTSAGVLVVVVRAYTPKLLASLECFYFQAYCNKLLYFGNIWCRLVCSGGYSRFAYLCIATANQRSHEYAVVRNTVMAVSAGSFPIMRWCFNRLIKQRVIAKYDYAWAADE